MASERTLTTFEGLRLASRNTFLHVYCDDDDSLAKRRPRRHSGPASLGCLEWFDSGFLKGDKACEATSLNSVARSTLDESFQLMDMLSEPVTVDEYPIDDRHRISGVVLETKAESLSAVAYRCFSVRSTAEIPSELPPTFCGDFDRYLATSLRAREYHNNESFGSSILSESSGESFSEYSPTAMDESEIWKQKGHSNGVHQGSQEFEQHVGADELDFMCHTVMIKNIPCGCTKREVLAAINDVGFRFNFFYLPHRRSKCLGYAFVGFRDPHTTTQFAKAMTGYRFEARNSPKTVEVVPARIQGVEDNKKHFQKTYTRITRRRPSFPVQTEINRIKQQS